MRLLRLFGVVILTILTAGLLLATPAGAQPASKLTDHITDNTGALTGSDRATVNSAIERLYRDRHVQLWVVYVDNYSNFKPENWAAQTRGASLMGERDVLLAVATNTKRFALDVPSKVGVSAADVESLRSNRIAPAVGAKNWSGAAVAAADGLNVAVSAPAQRNWLPIAIAIGVGVVVVVVLVLIFRARRRRRAARQVESVGGQVNIDGRADSLPKALAVADARLHQISDYVAKHQRSIGAQAKARFEEAKQHLAAAHETQANNEPAAIAEANRASTLAAQAQELANADVLGAHRTPRGRGTGSKR